MFERELLPEAAACATYARTSRCRIDPALGRKIRHAARRALVRSSRRATCHRGRRGRYRSARAVLMASTPTTCGVRKRGNTKLKSSPSTSTRPRPDVRTHPRGHPAMRPPQRRSTRRFRRHIRARADDALTVVAVSSQRSERPDRQSKQRRGLRVIAQTVERADGRAQRRASA